MQAVSVNAPNISYHEDTLIVHSMRDFLEANCIKFAPLTLAKKFSYEMECDDLNVSFDDVFAFHGKSHTADHVKQIKHITSLYYRDVLPKLSKEKIQEWLQREAGSQDPSNFFGDFKGNLTLQQIPQEYVNLLEFFRSRDISSYLELGVGNGGSFFTNSLFIGEKCNKFHAVDNIAYANTHIKQTEAKIMTKIKLLSNLFPEKNIEFFNSSTDDFFTVNKEKYDCIFIDADHSYEGVKKDYENSIKALNKNGVLVFHDIGNTDTGVAQLWKEVKHKASKYSEFLWKPDWADFYNCGIGIYFV
jgi:predicted O-methyltransferase YrrM